MFNRPNFSKITAPLLATVMVLCCGRAQGADLERYVALPNLSKLRMDGTSTIHNWHAETTTIGGSMELEAGFPEGGAKGAPSTLHPKVEVRIPVRSLKTSGGKRMDAVMQEHMHYDQHKLIQYQVLELAPKAGGGASGATSKFDAKGALTVAGVTRTNHMDVTIERVDGNRLKVSGATALKMTDFGIKPPAPDIGLGLIKTGDEIKLTFEWVTEKRAQQAKAP